MKAIYIFFIFGALIYLTSCDDNKNEDELILPCDIESENLIEINNIQTKLYYIVPDPTLMGVRYPQGIKYDVINKQAFFSFNNQNGTSFTVGICNFPEYAGKWNITPKMYPTDDDGIEIFLSGIIYPTNKESNHINGDFELTLLKK